VEVSGVTTRSEATLVARPLDRNVMRVLHLTLKRQWFEMIASGQKREEYREMKPYWHKRLMCANGKFDAIHFRNGYSRGARSMTVELRELRSGLGIVEWGAPDGQEVYILRLGSILQTHNCEVSGIAPKA
jgi:hypothetical protein